MLKGKFRNGIVVAKAALGVSGPLVVSLGALIPRKGHDIVMRAVASIPGATLLVTQSPLSEGATGTPLTVLSGAE